MFSFQISRGKDQSDLLGAIASGLCLIHCLATPFLFVAHAGVHAHGHHDGHHAESPFWWGLIDITLLIVSLTAVYWSVKNTSKQWMKYALYASWAFLAFIILNEKFEMMHLAEAWVYFPALSLVVLHVYNRKYCQCADEACDPTPGLGSA